MTVHDPNGRSLTTEELSRRGGYVSTQDIGLDVVPGPQRPTDGFAYRRGNAISNTATEASNGLTTP